jgi:uncharacterized protein
MTAPRGSSPLRFFALVLCLSTPFWLLGAATHAWLMPGLSVSALMAFCPMVAAMILVHRSTGRAGVTALLRRSLDFRRITDRRWYVPVLLLMPGVSGAVYILTRLMGVSLPASQVSGVAVLVMSVAFFIGALGEELGWSAYALDPMLQHMSAFRAGITLGLVTVVWHLGPLMLLHRSPGWIAWWILYAMGARVLIVWLYNNTNGSLFGVALFHATLNLSYMLFPIYGSHFDMRLGGIVTAVAAAAITAAWGPTTLTRHARAASIAQ